MLQLEACQCSKFERRIGGAASAGWKEHVLAKCPWLRWSRHVPAALNPVHAGTWPRSWGTSLAKVDLSVRSFEEAVVLLNGSAAGSGVVAPYGQPSVHSVGAVSCSVRGADGRYIVVTFFGRKVKKALFGLISNEVKTVFEKWILRVTITSSPTAS